MRFIVYLIKKNIFGFVREQKAREIIGDLFKDRGKPLEVEQFLTVQEKEIKAE